MKAHTSTPKVAQRAAAGPSRGLSAGRSAISRLPPAYGIDLVDNRTALPAGIKAGLEHLSGLDLSGVRVHHDSAVPAQLQAQAFTRGADIYLAPGQERHLPHEGWHAVQQLAGRVPATGGIYEDPALEREADDMGARAQRVSRGSPSASVAPPASVDRPLATTNGNAVVQRVKWGNLALGAVGTALTVGLAWASAGFRSFMRDAWYGTVVLAEEQSNTARSGQMIRYTQLAGGCMAVTVLFQGGGGAGLHLAMQPQHGPQWPRLMNHVGGQTVTQVFVDSDMVNQVQGWYVPVAGGGAPRSYLELVTVDNLDDTQIRAQGWRYSRAEIQRWFAQTFGVAPQAVIFSENLNPVHVIP